MPNRLAVPVAAAALLGALLGLLLAGSAQARVTRDSEVTTRGVGPIHIGMTVAQARAAAGRRIEVSDEITRDCRIGTVAPRRLGLSLLIFRGRVRVLSTARRGLATRKGIRVGDRLDDLRGAYGRRLRQRPSDVSPQTRIFEVRNRRRELQFKVGPAGRIFELATGRRPEVDFSEGCA